MSLTNSSDRWLPLAGAAALVALVVVVYLKRKDIGAAVSGAVDLVNPVSPDNIVNRTVTAAGSVLAGSTDGSWTVGGAVYDGVDTVKGWFGWGAPKADAPTILEAKPGANW